MKLGMVKYSRSLTSVVVYRSDQPGADPGRAKIGNGGPLLQETSTDRKVAATNRIHNKYLEACGKMCCCFWFHSEVKFWRVFDVFLDLVILPILMQFL